jgi:hypothetical protein
MKKLVPRASFGILMVIIVTLGTAVWTTRPVSAQEPVDYSAWCQRVHSELFSKLPASMQQHLMAMHGKHVQWH